MTYLNHFAQAAEVTITYKRADYEEEIGQIKMELIY